MMSNEKDYTNKPRANARSRNFSLTTYLTESQINMVLLQHSNQIKVYAYILHDKDVTEDGEPKEPHYHIILCLYNATSVSAVKRWFSGFTDSDGKEVNTLGQVCKDIFNSYDYLSHSTKQCIADGKHQYEKTSIVCNDKNYFKASEESEFDNITLAVMDMLNNVPLRVLFKKYGRDFIIHYSACSKVVGDILLYENKGNYNFLTAQEDYYLNENKKFGGNINGSSIKSS